MLELADSGAVDFTPLYEDSLPLWDKAERIATRLYGASGIAADDRVRKTFDELQGTYGHFPVCMAKTQYSLSADPGLKGAPSGHVVPIREVRVSGGAGFVVVVTGAGSGALLPFHGPHGPPAGRAGCPALRDI